MRRRVDATLDLVTIWAKIFRRRLKIIDGTAVAVLTAFAAFVCFEIDVFEAEVSSDAVKAVTLEEVMIVAAIFCAGMTTFALRRLGEVRREAAGRVAAEREARNLALLDALTGLPNHRSFDDALKVATGSPPRAGGSHVLLMMDLNGFKRINDLYGHQVGDEVLIQVGGRLARALREGDLIARLGGDEFAVLAMHTSGAESATSLAGRMMEALHPPINVGNVEQTVGIAIGMALSPGDATSRDEWVRKADVALYRAKAEKHRAPSAACFFEAAMDVQARERDQLERELRVAITDRAIRPFYQPLVSLDGSGITGFEALARWTSPVLGEVSPERFVAVAEDAGLIGELTTLLLEQACADAARWPSDITLAFNLSGVVLQDPMFGLAVLQIIARNGLLPERLELEITESALVRDVEAARVALDNLRAVGMRVALDDFGTGYSSLYHLRAFKPDKIKIDRSFVSGMEHDPDSAAIVRGLIGLGAGLGVKVTAEGVENAQQRAILQSQGCDQGQGHLFSQAVDAAGAMRLVGRPERDSVAGGR